MEDEFLFPPRTAKRALAGFEGIVQFRKINEIVPSYLIVHSLLVSDAKLNRLEF